MKSLAVHGSHVLEFCPFYEKLLENLHPKQLLVCYLGKVPRDTLMHLFCVFDHRLQPAVGECVSLVELQITLVFEEATASIWRDVSDLIRRHDSGGEVDEVLPPCLKIDVLVPHHRKLRGLPDEHLEGAVLLVKAAEGHCVGVEVQGES